MPWSPKEKAASFSNSSQALAPCPSLLTFRKKSQFLSLLPEAVNHQICLCTSLSTLWLSPYTRVVPAWLASLQLFAKAERLWPAWGHCRQILFTPIQMREITPFPTSVYCEEIAHQQRGLVLGQQHQKNKAWGKKISHIASFQDCLSCYRILVNNIFSPGSFSGFWPSFWCCSLQRSKNWKIQSSLSPSHELRQMFLKLGN